MSVNFGFMGLQSGNSPENAMQFMVKQIIRGGVSTAMIVLVKAVDTTARTVDIVPMVDQVTATGQVIPHSVLHEIPYGYEQGGNCLIKIDPAPGDIGVAVFAHRDITRVKRTKQAAAPPTLRTHHLSDGLYVRTLWAASAPEHSITFNGNGITVSSNLTVDINAKTKFRGDMEVDGAITATGDVTGAGISLKNHTHSVTDAPGTTGVPK